MATVRYTVIDGEVISEKRSGVRRQYVPDPLGSTVALLDNTQTKTDTFSYWPYGEEATRTGTTATPFRYVGTVGYYRDSTTKNYVRARYLDVQLGQWMTEDPIRFDGGDWNLYRYALSNPATLTDLLGTQVDPHDPPCRVDWSKLPPDVNKCVSKCWKKNSSEFMGCVKDCLKKGLKDNVRDVLCFVVACKQYGGTNPCKDPDKGNIHLDCSACVHFELSQCLCKSSSLWDTFKCYCKYNRDLEPCIKLPDV